MKRILAAAALALGLTNGEVIPFDNDAIEKVFKDKNPALFLFSSDNEQSKAANEAFKALDEEGADVILTVSDSNDGHGFFDRLGEYLGVDVKNAPKVLYLGDKADKYNFDGESISKEALASFLERVKKGEVEQFLKSAAAPESNDEAVKIAVGSTFKELVMDSDKEVLVKFYAPWCGHCKNLAPHYEEAAKKLSPNPNLLLVKVDSTENEVAGMEIQGFPTLKFWGKDKSKAPIDYTGDRTADGIIAWMKEHTEYEWVETETKENTEEL